ncbi:retropepsin-like aspartic protease [Dysgonomonas sp. 25]|uniref:retropepsin-like aspartic protease n=1 Tax=Dysgonomonas sp. 25 TaxID=2302933 RepID=UPI0013D144AC|nr:retropepsin-like aspartic protease [Dysgonomonas sp. 25]NDV70077.1 hypothetical protein [Dysgonomonas sp. 25]
MKVQKIFSIICCLIISLQLSAQEPNARIGELIGGTDYFELKRQYDISKDSIIPLLQLLSEALISDALNKPEEAEKAIQVLLTHHQGDIGVEGSAGMIGLWSNNLIKQGKYREAAELLAGLIQVPEAAAYMSEGTLIALTNAYKKASYLQNCPPDEIVRSGEDCVVSLEKNSFGLPTIPVEIDGEEVRFIFDTGADAPGFISMDFAQKYGIEIIGDSILAGGITHVGYAKIGFKDQLKIGNITYKNVWFIVAPSADVVYNDSVVASLDPILGRHFMEKVGEFQIFPKEGKVVFPLVQSPPPAGGSNMMLLQSQPYIEGFSDDERLLFHFDTGGGISLHAPYYRKHKEFIDANYVCDSVGIGGFGGAKRMAFYKIPHFPLQIGDTKCELNDIGVLTEDLNMGKDGSLGMDFIYRFDKAIFNFREMYLRIENE